MTTNTKSINDVNIDAVAALAGAITEEAEKGQTVWQSEVRWTGGFRSEARSRDFAPTLSDEPVGLGGTDTAPNPVEQLLGALGNCLAVGYASNATALGIELADLRIELEGDLDLHTFLGLNPDGNAGYETIKAQVHLSAPQATAEEIDTLHAAVTTTSPVGHTLARAVPVAIDLA